MAKAIRVPVVAARRVPDPTLKGGARHVLMVRAQDMPDDLPLTPNPRAQRIDRGIYKDVKESLLSRDGFFHLKNKGITLIADDIREIDDRTYSVSFGPPHGIVDGGHTYKILLESRDVLLESAEDDLSSDQFAKLEILTGIPDELYVEIAGGLNTAVQVQLMSLANLEDTFRWMKNILDDQPYADKIAYRENEKAAYDARDMIVFLELFNVFDYPSNGEEHPTRAYNNKAEVLKGYLNGGASKYEKIGRLLTDILVLHDVISQDGPHRHNIAGGRAGRLAFVDYRERGRPFDFHFTGKQGRRRLNRAALYPMLGAFRWMVATRSDGTLDWHGGFENVLNVWARASAELMRATQATCAEYKYKLTNLGKSRNHWATLFNIVARHELMMRN